MLQSTLLGAAFAVGSLFGPSSAQVTTECDPTKVTCPNDQGLATDTYSVDFTSIKTLPSEWQLANYAKVNLGSQGAEFTFAKRYDAPTLWTKFKFFFGRVEFVVKAAPGVGIISSMVLLSDDLDEVDWEFLGGVTTNVQTNYFGKGFTGTYNRSTSPAVASPQTQFHTYALDWSPTALVWSIDGVAVRTLNAADADGIGSQYPQSPMKVSLSLWDAGDPDSPAQGWGGGVTPIPPPEPYTMYVKSVKIFNSNPAQQYQYTDKSGSWRSIKVINDALFSSSSSLASTQAATLSLGFTSSVSSAQTSQASAATSQLSSSSIVQSSNANAVSSKFSPAAGSATLSSNGQSTAPISKSSSPGLPHYREVNLDLNRDFVLFKKQLPGTQFSSQFGCYIFTRVRIYSSYNPDVFLEQQGHSHGCIFMDIIMEFWDGYIYKCCSVIYICVAVFLEQQDNSHRHINSAISTSSTGNVHQQSSVNASSTTISASLTANVGWSSSSSSARAPTVGISSWPSSASSYGIGTASTRLSVIGNITFTDLVPAGSTATVTTTSTAPCTDKTSYSYSSSGSSSGPASSKTPWATGPDLPTSKYYVPPTRSDWGSTYSTSTASSNSIAWSSGTSIPASTSTSQSGVSSAPPFAWASKQVPSGSTDLFSTLETSPSTILIPLTPILSYKTPPTTNPLPPTSSSPPPALVSTLETSPSTILIPLTPLLGSSSAIKPTASTLNTQSVISVGSLTAWGFTNSGFAASTTPDADDQTTTSWDTRTVSSTATSFPSAIASKLVTSVGPAASQIVTSQASASTVNAVDATNSTGDDDGDAGLLQ
ncbi:MAG: hypothetical protein L6R40_008213 [Gallowayella cf. fulva]|nr:MAG: hypothetical protein L6R40_008213 [Xanthomendoza cf. fulva]